MNSSVARKIFEVGAKARNPSLFTQYDFLKSTEWLSRPQLRQIQLERAQTFLQFCERHSPFYKTLFRDRGFNPAHFASTSDLALLPEIDKETLIHKNTQIHSDSINEKCRLSETSGTSGESLAFYRNEGWDSLNRATMMRSYDWYDVKPWQPNGYLWGFNISGHESRKVALLDALQNRFRLFRYSEKEIRNFSVKMKNASFISGYSSMIYEVAKAINDLGLGPLPLKLVKGTSEMILDAYHPASIQAFGRKITSEYGAAEAGLIAFECPEGGIHINIENVILELNENGELLVTNLASYSFPIIRYNLGDIVTFRDDTCPCGRAHPLIETVAGRKGANVYGKEDVYPALTFYYVFKNLALEKNILINYKAVQGSVGKVDIYVEDEINRQYEKHIDDQLNKYFGEDILFNVVYVKRFENEQRKKQYFETSL